MCVWGELFVLGLRPLVDVKIKSEMTVNFENYECYPDLLIWYILNSLIVFKRFRNVGMH